MVWCSCLFKTCPQFVVIHTVKGFSQWSRSRRTFFEFPCFFMTQRMLEIWFLFFLVPLPLLNPPCTSGSSQFMYCWSLAWRSLSITLLACEMSGTVQQFEHSLQLPIFGIGVKTDLFQLCSHFWVYQICLHIECRTLTASFFRIWNSWAGIPSPPLALFVVMLQKAHLSSHSRMSSSRLVTTPL